jgi:ribonuclease P protein component
MVIGGQRVYAGRTLVAFARPNPEGRWRVGVAVSRGLRQAVDRNRARRRLREAARTRLLPQDSYESARGIGYDVVLIGRPAAVEAPASVLAQEVTAVRNRLRRR